MGRVTEKLWRALKPVVEVWAFLILFLALLQICAAPWSHLIGRNGLGPGYTLFLTVLLVAGFQVLVHHEPLTDLGIRLDRSFAGKFLAGFAIAVSCVCLIMSAQAAAGWVVVRPNRHLDLSALQLLGGVGLALLSNIGVGFSEELLFRGYVMRRLLKGYAAALPAVLISSLFFCLFHMGHRLSWQYLTIIFLLGLVLSLAYLRTGSLWTCVGLHAGWDYVEAGPYLYQWPQWKTRSLLLFKYNIHSPWELAGFKILVMATLMAGATALAFLLRRRRDGLISGCTQ